MATYRYECPNCGEFEIEQSMRDAAIGSCPSCGSTVKKLIPSGVTVKQWSMLMRDEKELVKTCARHENAFQKRTRLLEAKANAERN